MALFDIVTVEKMYKVGEVTAMSDKGVDYTIGKRDYKNIPLNTFVQLCVQQRIVAVDKDDLWVCKDPSIKGTNFFERLDVYHNRIVGFLKELFETK